MAYLRSTCSHVP